MTGASALVYSMCGCGAKLCTYNLSLIYGQDLQDVIK